MFVILLVFYTMVYIVYKHYSHLKSTLQNLRKLKLGLV